MEHNFTWKNDGRTKVMIGCGTRPEIIRLAAVIKRCREYFDCCVVYYRILGGFLAEKHLRGVWPGHSGASSGRESGCDLRKHSGAQL